MKGMKVRLSAGTAAVAGLCALRSKAKPSTAYLLVGEACARQCAFCPQGQASLGPSRFVSRISWPDYNVPMAVEALKKAINDGAFRRICLQVTQSPANDDVLRALLRSLAPLGVPVSMSRSPEHLDDVGEWFNMGVERMGLPLDTATASLYHQVKGGDGNRAEARVRSAARAFPGRINTHLIIGLGETEQEAVAFLETMTDFDIRVGLFAFTPVKGTPLADVPPPSVGSYRRIQAVRYLLARGLREELALHFEDGKLTDFGMKDSALVDRLRTGEAFMTSGCSHCNRPYYNERPRGIMYNFPHSLTRDEVTACLEQMTQ